MKKLEELKKTVEQLKLNLPEPLDLGHITFKCSVTDNGDIIIANGLSMVLIHPDEAGLLLTWLKTLDE